MLRGGLRKCLAQNFLQFRGSLPLLALAGARAVVASDLGIFAATVEAIEREPFAAADRALVVIVARIMHHLPSVDETCDANSANMASAFARALSDGL